jgi:hypothetical protein
MCTPHPATSQIIADGKIDTCHSSDFAYRNDITLSPIQRLTAAIRKRWIRDLFGVEVLVGWVE